MTVVSLVGGPCDGLLHPVDEMRWRIQVNAPLSLLGILTAPDATPIEWDTCTYEVALKHADDHGGPCLHPERDKAGHPIYRYQP